MLQKLLIVVPLAWLAVVPASGQETPASAPAFQPAQENRSHYITKIRKSN